jgi:hypothetical protein
MRSAARAMFLSALCLTAAAAACTPKPSGENSADAKCAKLDPVPAAICADSALQKLEGEIAVALNRARELYPNDTDALQALNDLRADAIRRRQFAGADGAISLADALQGERDFLRALVAPREGFEGRWISPQGDILITQEPDGFGLHAVAAEPSRGAWVCEVQTPAALIKNVLVAADGPRGLGDPPLDGWIIEAARQGATLLVKEVAPRADAGMSVAVRPYCGMSGGLDGPYFPANSR